MEGKVTSVSAKTGWVHVKTSEGTILVHFPPAEVADVKKGDTVSVDLAMKDNGPAKPKAAKVK
jgi:cold shock CspA family protein